MLRPTAPRVVASVGGLLAAILPAQQRAGLLSGTPPAGILTSTAGYDPGAEVMWRLPGDAYRGIGAYAGGTNHRIRGVVVNVRDATLADGETFDLHVYLEAGQSNLPTIPGPALPGTTAVASVRDLTTPAGIADHELAIEFAQPVLVPSGSDLFVSIHLRTPGLRLRTLIGTGVGGFSTSLFDACGPGLASNEAFSLVHVLGSIQPGGSAVVGIQPLFDLLVDGASGVGVARLQPNAPPTASFYSGLHPDSAEPSHQPGRRDQPGYLFLANGTVAAGSPVFLLGSTLPFTPPPFVTLQPGNAVLHLFPVGLVGLGFGTVGIDGTALVEWPIPASPAIRGVDVRSQAFAFDVGSGSVAAGAAVRQRF